MSLQISYPLYLIPLEGGYVSVVDEGPDDQRDYFIAVFTAAQAADDFMRDCGLSGSSRAINSPREFSWLLQSLRSPVDNIAFDPIADAKKVAAKWIIPVVEFMSEHLVIDYSPWNYPIFVIDRTTGYASIEGESSDGDPLVAVGLFTSREKAEEYLRLSGETGTIEMLADVDQARRFLEQVSIAASAAALDPTIDDDHCTARYCFSIRTVLDKYLAREP